MDDLRLVGLSEDGSRLVLEDRAGQPYALPVDERVHAALRGDRARLGQLQINLESQLRPREIQSRIRAGQTAEQIAADAGLPEDRIRRYEGPILLERHHMAELARAVGVRRVTDSVTTPLGVLVQARLDDLGVAESDLAWDSWRRDDGRWQLVLTYPANGRARAASWVFDSLRRTIDPADPEARWLTDEEQAAPPPVREAAPRLQSVPAPQPDPEVGEFDTQPVLVAAQAPAVDAARPAQISEAPDAEPEPEPAKVPARTAGRGSRRAAVPSWDEILFGASSKRDDS